MEDSETDSKANIKRARAFFAKIRTMVSGPRRNRKNEQELEDSQIPSSLTLGGSATQPKGGANQASLYEILQYSLDILDKKYRLYMWCEAKVSTLVTLDGLILAGVFVLIRVNGVSGSLDVSFMAATLAFLLSSLLIALWHIKPLMYSGRTTLKNLRTTVGTEAYSSTKEYADEMMQLSIEKMIRLDAEQIRGMNKNIMDFQKAIRLAVILTSISIFPLALLVASAVRI